MIGAISRTRPLMKPKREIGLAMSKWWKKKRPADAQVRFPRRCWSLELVLRHSIPYPSAYLQITMHLSMNEQQAVLPWIKTFPKKVVQRVPIYLWPFGSFAAIYGLVEFTNSWDYSEDISHRF
jgi:hypothetical protein